MYDQIFGAGAEADFGAPEAKAGGDVVLGLAAGVAAPGFFVEGVGDPGRGPDLAVVGVAAELEVDAGLFGFFKMVRLVVEQNGESCRLRQLRMLRQLRQLLQGLSAGVRSVVAADEADSGHVKAFVLQHRDAGFGVELFGAGEVAVVLVVAWDGVDRGGDAPEFGGEAAFFNRADAAVDDVAAEQDQVGLLGIDQIDPAGQFGPAVVIADVQVAGQDDRQRPLQRLLRHDCQLLAILVLVMHVPDNQQEGDQRRGEGEAGRIVSHQRLGNQMTKRRNVGDDEEQEQIEEGDQPRRSSLIQDGGRPQGKPLAESDSRHKGQEPQHKKSGHAQFPRPPGGRNPPQVPDDIPQ